MAYETDGAIRMLGRIATALETMADPSARVEEAEVWPRELSAAEVAALHADPAARMAKLRRGLVGVWVVPEAPSDAERACPSCDGVPAAEGAAGVCRRCGGSGKIGTPTSPDAERVAAGYRTIIAALCEERRKAGAKRANATPGDSDYCFANGTIQGLTIAEKALEAAAAALEADDE